MKSVYLVVGALAVGLAAGYLIRGSVISGEIEALQQDNRNKQDSLFLMKGLYLAQNALGDSLRSQILSDVPKVTKIVERFYNTKYDTIFRQSEADSFLLNFAQGVAR